MSKTLTSTNNIGGELFNPDIYKKFVEWYALPDLEKVDYLGIEYEVKGKQLVPKEKPTQKAFAKKFGISEQTLAAWKRRDDFPKAVDRKQLEWGIDRVSNVLSALYKRCLNYGKAEDVELWLAYYKSWDKKQVVKLDREAFSMNDLKALVEVLPPEKQQAFYDTITNIIEEAEVARGGEAVQGLGPDRSGHDS